MKERKLVSKIILFLILFGVSGLYTIRTMAIMPKLVTITADKNTASVTVTISDPSLDGKEISLICYNPQGDGSFSDWSKNQKHMVYLNQYKVKKDEEIKFRINEQPTKGLYYIVIGSANGKSVYDFRFITDKDEPGPVEDEKLNTPKSLKAVQSGPNQVTLTWNKVEGAKSYDIYRSAKASSGYTKIGTVTTVNYQDKKASAGKTWYYKVSAISTIASANSAQSSSVKVLVMKAPSIKAKSAAKGKMKISWKKISGANGYQVCVASKKAGKYQVKLTLKGISKTNGTLKKLKKSKFSYVKVRAYKTIGGKKVYGKFSTIKAVRR